MNRLGIARLRRRSVADLSPRLAHSLHDYVGKGSERGENLLVAPSCPHAEEIERDADPMCDLCDRRGLVGRVWFAAGLRAENKRSDKMASR